MHNRRGNSNALEIRESGNDSMQRIWVFFLSFGVTCGWWLRRVRDYLARDFFFDNRIGNGHRFLRCSLSCDAVQFVSGRAQFNRFRIFGEPNLQRVFCVAWCSCRRPIN